MKDSQLGYLACCDDIGIRQKCYSFRGKITRSQVTHQTEYVAELDLCQSLLPTPKYLGVSAIGEDARALLLATLE